MRIIRAIFMPVLLLTLLLLLAGTDLQVSFIAAFAFIWDILLGFAMGATFALLPQAAGFEARQSASAGMFWFCAFATLLIVCYQYVLLITGMEATFLQILTTTNARMRIVEGAMLGFCSFIAGRGKV